MKLIDIEQEVCVPLYDEDQGISYEQIMTIENMFKQFLGQMPLLVDAIPVEWLEEHDGENISDTDGNIYGRRSITISKALSIWRREQEGRDSG